MSTQTITNTAGDLTDLRLAVLIDGDNASHNNIESIMEEVNKYGNPTIKRIYGDWTKPNADGWKKELLENAITPVQQFAYTTGKNATDSALIIDAMDILYTSHVEGFCIVSSDSDFTRLATRLREEGKIVIGMGEEKTPLAFIKACDRFIYLSVLNRPVEEDKSTMTNKDRQNLTKMIRSAINDVADESGYAFLADVGNLVNKRRPDFDPRNYGFYKLTPLIRNLDAFQIDERPTSNPAIKHIYIKNKNGRRSKR